MPTNKTMYLIQSKVTMLTGMGLGVETYWADEATMRSYDAAEKRIAVLDDETTEYRIISFSAIKSA